MCANLILPFASEIFLIALTAVLSSSCSTLLIDHSTINDHLIASEVELMLRWFQFQMAKT